MTMQDESSLTISSGVYVPLSAVAWSLMIARQLHFDLLWVELDTVPPASKSQVQRDESDSMIGSNWISVLIIIRWWLQNRF